jgi:hypothetical protein
MRQLTLNPDLVFPWGIWFGLTAADRPLVLRNTSSDELYALDLKYR